MAEGGVSETVRQEWHRLLVRLKTTADGLLASHSSNVWNTYGGLDRICKDMEHILNHHLKVAQSHHGSSLDFWNFVRGLRWLNPTMAPTIEQFHKMTRGGSSGANRSPSRGSVGRAWLRQSLLDHTTSSQLTVLVCNRQYLLQHYDGDGFLCQTSYQGAMLQCLNAVEQNRAALLADINPIMLSRVDRGRGSVVTRVHTTHIVTSDDDDSEMIRSRNLPRGHLVPMPIKSPHKSMVPTITQHEAKPLGLSIYREESATEALRNVLNKSETTWEDDDEIDIGIDSEILNDPLMNIKVIALEGKPLQTKSASFHNFSRDCDQENVTSNKLVRSISLRKSKSRTEDLLDRVLNDDDDVLTKSIANEESKAKECDRLQSDIQNVGTSPKHIGFHALDSSTPEKVQNVSKPQTVTGNTSQTEPISQSASTKKYSHKRSTSDFGVHTHKKTLSSGPSRERERSTSSSTLPVSCSLPNISEEEFALRHKDGVFLQPAKGQSLRSFLSSQDFHTCAVLDKENAHFTLAEGLISAIEQMKWNQIIRPQHTSDHEDGDSDEEIQQLKQRIRIRRRERLQEKAENFPAFFDDKMDDVSVVSPDLTSASSSPCFSSISQESSVSSDSVHDEDLSEVNGSNECGSNLTTLSNSGLSLSMASLYSDVEIQKSNAKLEKAIEIESVESAHSVLQSAESVAMSLLRRFSEKQLPKASELVWLVSEQDAPQQLLPLPDSYPISPDDSDSSQFTKFTGRTRIRGNLEWAPPRAQIIFNIHPPPKRKVVLARQNYRCAGCGAKVEPGYTKRYRYCEYLGKYFCPCCHGNELAYIPGHILRRWDFTKYHVSNFSRDLLQRIHKDALFNLMDINETLYRKVRPLQSILEGRTQLRHLQGFLKTCRLGTKLLDKLEKLPSHWTNDLHLYSIAELLEIKNNLHLPKLKPLVHECITHVAQCPLCVGRGFICEVCRNVADIIFPFELNRVKQCTVCLSCFHKGCYQPDACPKCARIEARKQCLKEVFSNDEEESDHEEDDLPESDQIISR